MRDPDDMIAASGLTTGTHLAKLETRQIHPRLSELLNDPVIRTIMFSDGSAREAIADLVAALEPDGIQDPAEDLQQRQGNRATDVTTRQATPLR